MTLMTRVNERVSEAAAPLCAIRFDRVARRFLRDREATTAVEFSLIVTPLLVTILYLMSIGYMVFVKQGLDFATQRAARQVRIGAVQNAQLNQAQFRTQIVCPLLPLTVNCDNVIVNLQNVPYTQGSTTNYNSYVAFQNASGNGLALPSTLSNSSTSYCPGQGAQTPTGTQLTPSYVYLQIIYPVSMFLAMFSQGSTVTYNGQKVYAVMTTATFLNEPFVAPASAC